MLHLFLFSLNSSELNRSLRAEVISQQSPAVLIVVAVDTKIFPVRPVMRIIHMIAVSVMDGQEMLIAFVKFAPALATDKAMNVERLSPVVVRTILLARTLFFDLKRPPVFHPPPVPVRCHMR